ncbi:MAG: ADP-ribosylglycohydrolase family protein [Candidatus Promineifilaceae bacterium]
MKERYLGALLGLACGDAVGTTVEFRPRDSFTPLTDMVGGGPFNLNPGEWTDDTSMALCLAESLLERRGFDARDQAERYCRWKDEGYLSSNGRCFDIGMTVIDALNRFQKTGDPLSGSQHPRSAGNGSIMRLAPIPMYFLNNIASLISFSAESSKTTHGTKEAVDGCRLFGILVAMALLGKAKRTFPFRDYSAYWANDPLSPKIADIAAGKYRDKDETEIRGSGYVVESLEAALWCFYNTESYEEAVLKAANLGDDADTTAAVCGQLAGAYYGRENIPDSWLAKVALGGYIEELAVRLYEEKPS